VGILPGAETMPIRENLRQLRGKSSQPAHVFCWRAADYLLISWNNILIKAHA
jgi:hypothetical protein